MKKILGNQRILVRFMFSYLLILLIPLTSGSISFNVIGRILEKDLLDTNLAMLEQSKDIMDRWVDEVETIAQRLAVNNSINTLLDASPEEDPGYFYKMKVLLDDFIPYRINSTVIDSFYVYVDNTDYIITPETLYKAPFFYGYVQQYEGYEYEDWIKLFNKKTLGQYIPGISVSMAERNRKENVIPYLLSIPLTYDQESKGTAIILINEQEIRNLLKNLNVGEEGWSYVIDDQGKIITSLHKRKEEIQPINIPMNIAKGYMEKKIDEDNMLVSYVTSDYNGWKYVAVTPRDVVISKANYIKKIMIGFTVISLLLGVGIAYYLAARNTKPLKEIMKKLKAFVEGEEDPTDNTYEYLETSVAKLINRNKYFQETMKKQMPLVYSTFMDRLLQGHFRSKKEVEAFASYVKVDLNEKLYAVFVITLYGPQDFVHEEIVEELDMTKVVIKEVLNEYIGDESYLHDIDENKIAVLITEKSYDKRDFEKSIQELGEKVYSKLMEEYSIKILFSVGNIYSDSLSISRSFQEASQIIENKMIQSDSQIVWFKDETTDTEIYYYPLDLKQRVINLAKAGEIEDLNEVLEGIYHENFIEKQLSTDMYQQLIFELRGTLIQLINQIDEKERLTEVISFIDSSKTLIEVWENIVNEFKKICTKANEQKRSHNVELKNQVIEYIHSAYGKTDFSRYDIASKFGLTEGYVSHFFKEQTGETFSGYLENIRIRQACKLLEDTNLTIVEISEQVGYNSVQSFRRAFKRVKGISPSSLRQ